MARQRGKRNLDDRLLQLLACGATVEVAASTLSISESTIYRRLRDREFRGKLQAIRGGMVERSAALLTAAGGEFVKTLLALIKPEIAAAVRLGAAKAGLEIGMKIREMTELEQRITALEEQLGQDK